MANPATSRAADVGAMAACSPGGPFITALPHRRTGAEGSRAGFSSRSCRRSPVHASGTMWRRSW